MSGLPSVVHIPMLLAKDGILYVEGSIEGHAGVWELDTGASRLSVNSRAVPCRPLTDSTAPSDATQCIRSIKTLQWGGVQGPTITNLVASFDVQGTSGIVGKDRLGIIGLAQLRPFLSVFDYRTLEVELYRLDGQGVPITPPPEPNPVATIPLKLGSNRQFYVPVQIGTETVYLNLDTGSYRIILEQTAADRLVSHLTMRPGEAISHSGSMGTVRSKLATLDRMSVGGVVYDSLGIHLQKYYIESGELGYPFFKGKRMGLNVQTQTLYIWK